MTSNAPNTMPATNAEPAYKRVLIKLSGEALMGDMTFGQDLSTIERICNDIKEAIEAGTEVAIVVGGGNIFRGIKGAAQGMERASADYMGMLATVLNALAIQNTMERIGVETRVLSAIEMDEVCEPYIRRRAMRHMERGRVIICAAGTGNPFFTTDTAAALRASELGCDALVKATQVDGVYDKDPNKFDDAIRYESLTYHDVLARDLKVMDTSAIALSRENKIPILVFSIHEPSNIARVLRGEGKCTIIQD